MMKLTKKLFIAGLSVIMACSLFAGVFSFNGPKVNASTDDQTSPSTITYKLSEELSKIGYTDEELATSGWDGATSDSNKRALFEVAYKKSAIEIYSAGAGGSPKYIPRQYYEWAGDGNAWMFSWTNAAGLSSGQNMGSQPQIGKTSLHTIYSGSNGLVWAFALVAPEKGTITIPEHVLTVGAHYSSAKAINIGFFKSSTVPSSFDPANSEMNMNSYEDIADYTIAEQSFAVEKGDRVYIALYADTQGDLVKDARTTITYDPTFVFEKELPSKLTYKLSEELGKISYTDEELAASGWNGTSRDANKQALYGVAFAKSAFKIYGAASGSEVASTYTVKDYHTWMTDGNGWKWSSTAVNKLCAGYNYYNELGWSADGNHRVYAANHSNSWIFELTAPEKGTITIPAHQLIVTKVTTGASLKLGISLDNYILPSDADASWSTYGVGTYEIAEQTFKVNKGDKIYINAYADGDQTGRAVHITWDPTFVFEKSSTQPEEPVIPEEPEEEGVIKVTLGDEIGKIVVSDEDKAATGWDGTLTKSAAKEEAFKLAFAKSSLKFYAASNSAVDYRQMEYWDYVNDGNAWTMNYSGINKLSAGTQSYGAETNNRWEAGSIHRIYSRSSTYHITYAIGFVAPEKGTITIPEHTLVIDSFTETATGLYLGYSKDSASRSKIKPGDASLNCVEYTQAGTYVIAEQTFAVEKGEVVYLNVYVGATGDDASASVVYNPTFKFVTDPCVLNGHTEEIDEAVAPTCTQTGLTEGKHCSVCNEVLVAQEVVDALGHSGEVEEPGYDATCTQTGLTDKMTCSVCGETFEQDVIPALGHDIVNHEAVAPTCTEIGWDAYETCNRCDYSTYVEKAALGHSMAEATCTLPATCTVCGHTEGSALGHDTVNHEAVAPTCTEIGWDAYETCNRCDYSTYVEKAALGHDMAEATCTLPKTCKNNCGRTEGEALGHIELTDEAVAPDCTQTGLTEGKHCGRCEEVLVAQEVVSALGHSMADATCTLPATCETCGHTEGSALGHAWDAATCLLPSTCSTCGETKGEALGHDMAPATCTEPSTCVNGCGLTEGEVIDHVYGEWEVVKAPTDVEEGLKKKACTHCGHEVEEILPTDQNYDLVSCAGAVSGSGLGLLLLAVSGALVIRKKRR